VDPLFVVDEPVIDLFDAVRAFESSNCIRKIHTVLAKVLGGFVKVPFVLQTANGTGYQYWRASGGASSEAFSKPVRAASYY
jgi:hypothetical protein